MSANYDSVFDELTVTADTDHAIGVAASRMTTTYTRGAMAGRQSVDPVVLIETDHDARLCPITLTVETARTLAKKLLAAADEAEAMPPEVHVAALRVIRGGGEDR